MTWRKLAIQGKQVCVVKISLLDHFRRCVMSLARLGTLITSRPATSRFEKKKPLENPVIGGVYSDNGVGTQLGIQIR